MSLILTGIWLNAAIGTNFITVDRFGLHFEIQLSKRF